jgi:hypothetical protein
MYLAIVLINTKLGLEKEVLGGLRAIPVVRYAYEVYGLYDIILKVEADSGKALRQAVSGIRKMAGIRSTLTMIVTSE